MYSFNMISLIMQVFRGPVTSGTPVNIGKEGAVATVTFTDVTSVTSVEKKACVEKSKFVSHLLQKYISTLIFL